MTDRRREDSVEFPRLFNAQDLGSSFKEVGGDLIQTKHMNVTSRWFHSQKDADLYIWLDPGRNILKQQISFWGQVVEWNIVEGVKTGLIIEDESEGPKVSGSDLVRFDNKPQAGPLLQAVELLTHISGLKEEERHELVRNFKASPTTASMPAQEFMDRFGEHLNRKPVARQVGLKVICSRILGRLKRWFRQ